MMLKMDEGEIVREYKSAKEKNVQIRALQELNCCSREDILRVLIRNGQDVTPAGLRRTQEQKDEVEMLIWKMLDEAEEEVKAAEERYTKIADCLKQYGGQQ